MKMISIEEMEELEETYTKEIDRDFSTYCKAVEEKAARLPNRFWETPWALALAKRVTKYMLEDVWEVKGTKERYEHLTREHLQEAKMDTMNLRLFKRSKYRLLLNAYPETKVEELDRVPHHYWQEGENLKNRLRQCIETYIGTNHDEIVKKFNSKFVQDKCSSIYLVEYTVPELLEVAYPGEFQPWEGTVSNKYWKKKENVIKAVKWLVEEKLGNSRERVKEEFSLRLIRETGTIGMLRYKDKGVMNIHELIELAYPGQYYPWELKKVESGFWKKEENIIKAIMYLYEEVFDNNLDVLLNNITLRLLKNLGLTGLYKKCGGTMPLLRHKIKTVVDESDISNSN